MANKPSQNKDEILARLNIQSEMEALGVQFVGRPSSTGWIPCKNPYKKDDNPSCGVNVGSGPQRGYLCAFNENGSKHGKLSGKPYAAYSFWDIAMDFLPGAGGDFGYVIRHYAQKTGVSLKSYTPPTEEYIEKCQRNVLGKVRKYLNTKRGLTDASIEKYKIGWDPKKERNTFPVYDADEIIVNIRYHNSDKKPKTLNHTGYGQARLWGENYLKQIPSESTILISEGEFDAMLLMQETGLTAVSPTNGKDGFDKSWVRKFHGHHVVLVWDCDAEGRKAVQNLVLPAFKQPVVEGQVLSIKAVWLFEGVKDKSQKDFTDYIVKAGGSGEKLLELIEKTEPYFYKAPAFTMPDPIPLSSFAEIDNEAYAGKYVTVPLYVFGENSEAYHAPTQVQVTHCPLSEKSKCYGRDDWEYLCNEPIPIHESSRVNLCSVSFSDTQVRGAIRDHVCDKGQRIALNINDQDRRTIREVFAHQVLEGGSPTERNELVEKPVYTIGGKIIPIGQYQATGFIHTHPRNQRPTMLINEIKPQAEDWQGFDLETSRKQLEALQKMSPTQIAKEFSQKVTRIYERDDLHLGVLLTLLSPLWIDFPGDGRIRGWISSIVIGDSGTGKTTVSESIFKYAGIGARVSGMTSSRTGITYALEFNERRGWRVKAGVLLKMSRQALIVDEAQDLSEFDLKTMAEAIDTGQLKIDRVEARLYESMTRCFFSCNPRSEDRYRQSNQRTMDSFHYPCQAISDIFTQMMIRRIDLCLFAAEYDIKDKSKIFLGNKPSEAQGKTNSVPLKESFRALVYYAWNLKPEQIIISDEIADAIRATALELTEIFGQCADLPIVYPEDFRKTFCRLVVAFAILDLSSDDDFQTITVQLGHVKYIDYFLKAIYSAPNCRLNDYSKKYAETHKLLDPREVINRFQDEIHKNPDGAKRIKEMLEELVDLPTNGRKRIHQNYFAHKFNVTRQTIYSDLKPFVMLNMLSASRGYSPTVRLVRFWSYLERNHPDFWKDLIG